MPKSLSTLQVARMVGVHKVTLQRWLLDGKIREPRRISNGGVNARVWSERDIERVRKYKQGNYRKGRGRKPKPKR
jgi:DNA-binding transcriptional MerR regulator